MNPIEEPLTWGKALLIGAIGGVVIGLLIGAGLLFC